MSPEIDLSSYSNRYSFNTFLFMNQGQHIVLDLSSITFIKPVDSVHLQCIIDQTIRAKNQGWIPSASIKHPRSLAVKSYLGRIGLYDKLKNYEYGMTKHDSNNFSELYFIANDRNAFLGEKVQELLERGRFATSGIISDLTNSMTEIANNIFYHSGKDYAQGWGYFAAQTYLNHLHLAFCDVGIGFRGSFKRAGSFEELSDSELIAKSLEESVTSTSDPWRGIGLFQVYEFIRDYSGTLTIESGTGLVSVRSGTVFKTERSWNMTGSLLSMTVSLV